MNHSEACRERIEKAISEDTSDDRAAKAKERIDNYLAEKVGADAEVGEEREQDPRELSLNKHPHQESRPRGSTSAAP